MNSKNKSMLELGTNFRKKASACLLLAAVGTGVSAQVNAESNSYLFNRAESFSWSGANPVTAYFNLLVGPPPENGNHAFTRNIIEFGMGYKNLEISLIHRNDQNLDFSDGARDFAYLNKNRGQIPLDHFYDVEVWGNQYQASGLKFAYTWQLTPSIDFTAAYSYLVGTEMISGYLGQNENGEGGQVAYTMREVGGQNRRVLAGNLHTDLYYTDDPFFRREVAEPSSRGFAFDVGFSWQIRQNLQLRAMVDDLSARLNWKDIPHTVADASGDMFAIDDQGFAYAVKSFDGTEGWGDYVQELTRRERLFVDYDRGKHLWTYNVDRYRVTDFHRLKYTYEWREHWAGRVGVEATTGAIELGLAMPYGELAFSFDDLDFDKAKTIGLLWSIHFKL